MDHETGSYRFRRCAGYPDRLVLRCCLPELGSREKANRTTETTTMNVTDIQNYLSETNTSSDSSADDTSDSSDASDTSSDSTADTASDSTADSISESTAE